MNQFNSWISFRIFAKGKFSPTYTNLSRLLNIR